MAMIILVWLGSKEAEKVRRFNFVWDGVDYETFRKCLFALFDRLDFENSYRQQLCLLVRLGAESVPAVASLTTDFSMRAYPEFLTDLQLDLAVDHFISGRRDASSLVHLRQQRVRRRIS